MNDLVQELIDHRDYYIGVAKNKLKHDESSAEDLIQNLTIQLLNSTGNFDGKNPRGYLIMSIRNHARTMYIDTMSDDDIYRYVIKNGYHTQVYRRHNKTVIRMNKEWCKRNRAEQFKLARSIVDFVRN